jgi:hypothetical protein
MDKFFCLEDKVLKLPGLYGLWSVLYFSNFVCLLCDSTIGPVRNFNILANGFSVIYCIGAGLNNIYGNQLPSTLLITAGPVHQYLYWALLGYFGGSSVFSSSPLGVMNWINSIVVGIFTLDMIFKTWLVTLYTKSYLEYVTKMTVKPEEKYKVKEEITGIELIN